MAVGRGLAPTPRLRCDQPPRMSTSRPLIALLTDFGLRDHYVASMKAAILSVCPDAALVDITHDIAPQDVAAAAWELGACCRDFPRGTVFACVVDPGVGSTRRALGAAAGAYRFVAPDNGLLSMAFERVSPTQVVQLTNPRYAAPLVSRTFEGRDRFAPAAAWLARGTALAEFGPPVHEWVRLAVAEPDASGETLAGEVLLADRFGNLVTNISERLLETFTQGRRLRATVTLADRRRLPVVSTYAEVQPGELCALTGSTGHLEIAVNCGSAATVLGLGRGARVTVHR